MLSLASRICFAATIALLVWAVVQMAHSGNATRTREALIIEEPERDLGEQFVGLHSLTFRVRNTTELQQRIIGSAEG